MSTSLEQVRLEENGSEEPQVTESNAKWTDWIGSLNGIPQEREEPTTKDTVGASIPNTFEKWDERNSLIETALSNRSLDTMIQDTRKGIARGYIFDTFGREDFESLPGSLMRNVAVECFSLDLAIALQRGNIYEVMKCFQRRNEKISVTALVEIGEWYLKQGRINQACYAFIEAGQGERVEEMANKIFDAGGSLDDVNKAFLLPGVKKTLPRSLRAANGIFNSGNQNGKIIYNESFKTAVETILSSLRSPVKNEIEAGLRSMADRCLEASQLPYRTYGECDQLKRVSEEIIRCLENPSQWSSRLRRVEF